MIFIGIIVGAMIGAMTMGLMCASGNASRCEECSYRATIKAGERERVFSEEDKAIYQPENELVRKRDVVQAIAEYEMYSAEMEYPGTASDDIEDWKDLGELILHGVESVEPMPNYINNVLVVRHY